MLESADLARLPSDRSRKWEIPAKESALHWGLRRKTKGAGLDS